MAKDKKFYLRLRLWWKANDAWRYVLDAKPAFSPEQVQNLDALAALFNESLPGHRILKAEIARKLGRFSAKDTRASYITNALDKNERMSFIQKQVGHTTTRLIVDHYYRLVPAPDDGERLEEAWNSTTLLPPSEDANVQVSEIKE